MLKDILAEIFPLHRTLVSQGTDDALRIVGRHMPSAANYALETYPAGAPAWTWTIPERYVVHEAFLESETGERLIDFTDNPLHLVSYSPPVERWLTWEELEPHLFYNEQRPQAIPWMYKYYERDWGFCLPKMQFDRLDRGGRYRAVIRSEFRDDPSEGLQVGVGLIEPHLGNEREKAPAGDFIVCAHICHPAQANDDAAGVVSAIALACRLAENPLPPGSLSVRFLFCPETIGSIAYLAHHEQLIANLKGGIFLEMTGTDGPLAWHHTRQSDHRLDRVTANVMASRRAAAAGGEPLDPNIAAATERPFGAHPANDERVINGPGVNVPCISLNRWPYPEYHTNEDSLEIIKEESLADAAEAAEAIVRIYASDYVPIRTFRGPVFLSGYGLWVDWRTDWRLNRAMEKITLCLEGRHSIFDIAEEVGLDYWSVREVVEKFRANGLIDALPIPSAS